MDLPALALAALLVAPGLLLAAVSAFAVTWLPLARWPRSVLCVSVSVWIAPIWFGGTHGALPMPLGSALLYALMQANGLDGLVVAFRGSLRLFLPCLSVLALGVGAVLLGFFRRWALREEA